MISSKAGKIILILVLTTIFLTGISFFSRNGVKIEIDALPNLEAAETKDTLNKASLSKKAKGHFRKGQEFLKQKQLEKALKEFKQVAKLSPESPIGYYWVGKCLFYKKQPKKAIDQFKKILGIDPKNYHALAEIGKILSFDKDRLDDATVYLRKALAINMDYMDAHFHLGRIHARKGEMSQALAEFSFIFRSEAQYAAYHYELGRIFQSMKATDRARNEFKRALQLNPKMSRAKAALKELK